jgi:hypothetical protein
MKSAKILALLIASAAFLPIQANAGVIPETQTFPLTKSKGPAASCPFTPWGKVTDHTFGTFENLEVVVHGLPANTDFVIFNIQIPNAPFGLAWYNGDILTDETGTGVINLVGRFSKGTFIVSQKALPSANIFPSPPAVLPQSKTGAQVDPVQIYHLGIWFNDHNDAIKAGCPGNQTPFTSNHDAGIQILNTGTFPDNAGPLLQIQ